MFTLATLSAWLASPVAGFLAKLAMDAFSRWLAQRQSDQNAKDVGRLNAEILQESAAREAADRQTKAALDAPQSVNDAVKRLEEGSA